VAASSATAICTRRTIRYAFVPNDHLAHALTCYPAIDKEESTTLSLLVE
jgi:hypothetical protein